jgi:BirA family biotin operon repressor/biotin-[acetyl-CoA-carboxylase] ligase
MGLNVQLPQADVTAELATAPAALAELPQPLTAASALMRVVPALVEAVREFEASGFAPFAERFAQRDVLKGRSVQLRQGDEVVTGEAAGVDASGGLLVHTSAGLQRVTSSEVSVRPRQSSGV